MSLARSSSSIAAHCRASSSAVGTCLRLQQCRPYATATKPMASRLLRPRAALRPVARVSALGTRSASTETTNTPSSATSNPDATTTTTSPPRKQYSAQTADEARQQASALASRRRAAEKRREEVKRDTELEDRARKAKQAEYHREYKSKTRKWTKVIVATPIALVTGFYLFERMVLGKERKEMPRLEAPAVGHLDR